MCWHYNEWWWQDEVNLKFCTSFFNGFVNIRANVILCGVIIKILERTLIIFNVTQSIMLLNVMRIQYVGHTIYEHPIKSLQVHSWHWVLATLVGNEQLVLVCVKALPSFYPILNLENTHKHSRSLDHIYSIFLEKSIHCKKKDRIRLIFHNV